MARYKRFTFLCDKDERRLIADLAKRLQRSQGDAVRYIVINAAKELEAQEQVKLSGSLRGVSDGH